MLRSLFAAPARRLSSVPKVRPLNLLLYSYCENATEVRKPFRTAHLAAAQAAVQRGHLLLGGALADPVDGGVLAFVGEHEAREFAENDPYVREGVVTEWTLREWSVVVGSLVDAIPEPSFTARYEWQPVPAGIELPAGLELELPLDGGTQRARIPPTWQLQVWIGDAKCYLRLDVTRRTKALALREAAASLTYQPLDAVQLRFGGAEVDDAQDVEGLELFGRESDLTVKLKGI